MLSLPLGVSALKQSKQKSQFDDVVKQHGIMGVVVLSLTSEKQRKTKRA